MWQGTALSLWVCVCLYGRGLQSGRLALVCTDPRQGPAPLEHVCCVGLLFHCLELILGFLLLLLPNFVLSLGSATIFFDGVLGEFAVRVLGHFGHGVKVEVFGFGGEVVGVVMVELEFLILDQVTPGEEEGQTEDSTREEEERCDFRSVDHFFELCVQMPNANPK